MDAVGTVKNVSSDVQERAHKIWLAGLGALASAGDEGTKLFDSLVKRGEKVEKKGRGRVDQAKAKVGDATEKARDQAGRTWNKVEVRVDRVVGGALERLGVPSRHEIATLTRRVEELTDAVSRLEPKRPATRKKAAAK